MLSLFSGIGGFDIAARWTGQIETVAFVEIDPFCQKVLKKHWPTVPIISDIREVTGERIRTIRDSESARATTEREIPSSGTGNKASSDTIRINSEIEPRGDSLIDILTGGFPCQPFSCAGKRKGTDDNRYLWPEMLRVIKEVRPRWIIGENVAGLISIDNGMVFEDCCASLEAEGYAVQSFILPACAVNAPHRRDRVWIVANSRSITDKQNPRGRIGSIQEKSKNNARLGNPDSNALHPIGQRAGDIGRQAGDEGRGTGEGGREGLRQEDGTAGPSGTATADTDAPDTRDEGLQGGKETGNDDTNGAQPHDQHDRGRANWDEPWIEVATRTCSRRVDDGLPPVMDLPGGVRSEPVETRKKDKTSAGRAHRLKALGNAIVPQVAFQILQAIVEIEKEANR